eukprot:Nitzschia sp. Nitz4//scaffold132_size63325//34830//38476//NITZ4_006292-RA/size63325-snap-gene-0.50-mRNA-1//1//CDS//3329535320//2258//frame0
MQPLELTVADLLQAPVKTCGGGKNNQNNCGIVTATKSTQLFALDARTGQLVWPGEGDAPPSDPAEPPTSTEIGTTSTVLLQREDVLIQQLSTDSGQLVWNVTWGSVQALDFDDGPRPAVTSGGNMDYHQDPWNPSTLALTSSLPSVIFGPDGTTLTAVSRTTGQVLWTRSLDTVVSAVFGLQDLWKPLDVWEDTSGSSASEDDLANTMALESTATSTNAPPSDTIPKPPTFWWKPPPWMLLWQEKVQSEVPPSIRPPTSYYSDRAGAGTHGTWPAHDSFPTFFLLPHSHVHTTPSTPLLPTTATATSFAKVASTSSSISFPSASPTAMDVLEHEHTSALNQQPSLFWFQPYYHQYNWRQGVFLTWTGIGSICIVTLAVAGLIFRYLYLHKKNKWMHLLQRTLLAASANLATGNDDESTKNTNKSSSSGTRTNPSGGNLSQSIHRPLSLQRSNSLPHPFLLQQMQQSISFPPPMPSSSKRRMRSESLQVFHTSDGRMLDDKERAQLLLSVQEGTRTSPDKSSAGSVPGILPRADSFPTTPPISKEVKKVAAGSLRTSTTKESSVTTPQKQDVAFLIDGIPLIRYSRYASEFVQVVPLGKGGFGTVFRCKNVLDGREYAIKKVSLKYTTGLPLVEFRQHLQRTLREVKSLALLDHKNIVRYYTAWLEQESTDQNSSKQNQQRQSSSKIADASQRWTDASEYLFPRGGVSIVGSSSWTPTTDLRSAIQRKEFESNRQYQENCLPLGGKIPDALDDYGFTFDRGSEDKVTSEEEKENRGPIHLPLPSYNDHEYSSYSSRDSVESSIDDAPYQQTDNRTESQDNVSMSSSNPQQTGQENPPKKSTSSEHQETTAQQGQNSSTQPTTPPSIMVQHILYIQMQFCSQKTLADFLGNPQARGSSGGGDEINIPYALSLFLQIAQGVEHVHVQGLIHRDLKPNNCFIDDSGVVKVGDFGLSRESSNENRIIEEDKDWNDSNNNSGDNCPNNCEITAGVGTRSYASPEQMQGSDYDASTDIYSLGIILFELCFPMYTGMERTIVLSKLRNHIFPDQWLESIEPSFPKLHTLLQSMISNCPSDRPSAGTVVRIIQSILEGFTISSLDKHSEGTILLRVEAKPREDVLRHIMELVKHAAEPDCIEILQYGLRGGTNKAIMEFAITSSTCMDHSLLGKTLVQRLEASEEVLLIRQLLATNYT